MHLLFNFARMVAPEIYEGLCTIILKLPVITIANAARVAEPQQPPQNRLATRMRWRLGRTSSGVEAISENSFRLRVPSFAGFF